MALERQEEDKFILHHIHTMQRAMEEKGEVASLLEI